MYPLSSFKRSFSSLLLTAACVGCGGGDSNKEMDAQPNLSGQDATAGQQNNKGDASTPPNKGDASTPPNKGDASTPPLQDAGSAKHPGDATGGGQDGGLPSDGSVQDGGASQDLNIANVKARLQWAQSIYNKQIKDQFDKITNEQDLLWNGIVKACTQVSKIVDAAVEQLKNVKTPALAIQVQKAKMALESAQQKIGGCDGKLACKKQTYSFVFLEINNALSALP